MNALMAQLENLVQPLLGERAMELVDLEVSRLGRKLVIRLFIDNLEGGITVEDCAGVNRELGRLLDVEDLIAESYVLEVSSPGLNRRIRKAKDFKKFLQAKVRVETEEKIAGRKKFRGTLLAADEEQVVLRLEHENVSIPLSGIRRANLEYNFDQPEE